MADINETRPGASSPADYVSSAGEDDDEVEYGQRSRYELDPNSKEAKWLQATENERRAYREAVLKKHKEESRGPAIAYEIDGALYAKAETRMQS